MFNLKLQNALYHLLTLPNVEYKCFQEFEPELVDNFFRILSAKNTKQVANIPEEQILFMLKHVIKLSSNLCNVNLFF